MKWLCAVCLVFLSFTAAAEDGPKPLPLRQAPANVQIINGKRFFLLQNVRRFTGDTNNPKALSVIHAPHPDGVVTGRHNMPLHAAPVPATSGTPATAVPAEAQKDQLLSIFAPEDKPRGPVTAAPVTK